MELFINSNTQIFKLMLKNLDISEIKDWTHTIYWPKKVTKKVTWAIYRPDEKKLKKTMENWNWTFHKWQY